MLLPLAVIKQLQGMVGFDLRQYTGCTLRRWVVKCRINLRNCL
jgi:hypothetical protein